MIRLGNSCGWTVRGLKLALGFVALSASRVSGQWVTTYEQFYQQASHNWEFRDRYQAADRLFNAFDFGHAILYETLWRKPNAPASELEQKKYNLLTRKVLVSPPRVPLEEAAIEIEYARLAPEAKQMFDWAHILHRQIYDVWADESLPIGRKDAEISRLIAYYKTRRDLAFSSRPKSMELMQEQPYSLAFRKQYPKFNGLIWAYHWLQIGLYEPLILGKTSEQRQAGVRATLARFWQMLDNPTQTMPYQMPMTAAVAPEFSRRYEEAAIIFDNLHSMHDVVSDILANDNVPRNRKRAELMRAARLYRDDTSYVMPVDAWRTMAHHMGIENMGGPAVGFLTAQATPSVTYGAVMTHDEQTGEMTGFKYGQATGGEHAGMQQGVKPDSGSGKVAEMDHSKMNMPVKNDSSGARPDSMPGMDHGVVPGQAQGDTTGAEGQRMESMLQLYMNMLADPVIARRMMADTATRRMMQDIMETLPTERRLQMERMLREATPSSRAPAKPRHAPRATAKPATKSKPADPHGGHQMPAPKPPR
ncbi:MAG: hypothetical protein H7Z74_16005 [Anaerolineae bacterium]|nr:hypothetical protein [Gemmatimonadaceae bacterium]